MKLKKTNSLIMNHDKKRPKLISTKNYSIIVATICYSLSYYV